MYIYILRSRSWLDCKNKIQILKGVAAMVRFQYGRENHYRLCNCSLSAVFSGSGSRASRGISRVAAPCCTQTDDGSIILRVYLCRSAYFRIPRGRVPQLVRTVRRHRAVADAGFYALSLLRNEKALLQQYY